MLAAAELDLTLLPTLYNELLRIGPVAQLDVLIQSRGGEVNASRRIAMLLRSFCQRLTFLVPYYCQSAATLLVLAADDLIAGELAMFSPIDPHLHGGTGEGAATTLSCQDIQQFGVMAQHWFGLTPEQAKLWLEHVVDAELERIRVMRLDAMDSSDPDRQAARIEQPKEPVRDIPSRPRPDR